jgi:acetyltransferase-like isoleucine patch superfamily enzyme
VGLGATPLWSAANRKQEVIMSRDIFTIFKAGIRYLFDIMYKRYLFMQFRIFGPPRILNYGLELNAEILRHFGARIGPNRVRLYGPILFHGIAVGARNYLAYKNLIIEDGCGCDNVCLDLTSTITLEKGVSLGPGVTIMTHNRYNYNQFLEERLSHTCGVKGVLIKEGSGIKAHALITMGVIVGKNAVVAGGAVVNRDVPDNCLVAGVPARVIKEIK